MATNIFAQGMDAFDRSWDRTQGFHDRATARKAGRALAGGDRAGAMQALGDAGQIDGVRTLQGDQRREDDRAAEQAQGERAEQMRRAELLIGVAGELKNVPPGQRKAALQHPIFQMAGLTPEQLSGLTEEDLSDQALDMFAGEVKKQVQVLNLGNGGVATVDPASGEFRVLREPDPRPVIIGNGGVAIDPETGQVVGRNPKTFAPPRPSGGGGSGGGPMSGVSTADLIAALRGSR